MVKTHLRHFLSGLVISTASLLAAAAPAHAQTQYWRGVCAEKYNLDSGVVQVATIQGFQCLIANILSVTITVLGLIGFAMIIVGAFRYMLSGGNTKGTENARNTITFAIVGLVVALSSVIILNLIAAFTGVNIITEFIIPDSSSTAP